MDKSLEVNDKKKKIAVIIGAGDFIGAAIAEKFASNDFLVFLGRRSQVKLNFLVKKLAKKGLAVKGYKMDARVEENISKMFSEIETKYGAIELVVFNAGGNVSFPIQETTSRVFRKVWEMGCFAGFLTGREAAKYMLSRGRGSIFFTGATASIRGAENFAAFSAAKSGLRALAQSMARELGPKNIHVAHLIIDAAVNTEFVRKILQDRGKDVSSLPPDTLMTPESVADSYWNLYNQKRDAWSFEMDIRPYGEKW